jgi:5-methylcytosine-specific restriction endonuclease McrA
MNWISQHKRLAIYARDGFACCYCGHAVEDGAQLTLDHVKPHVDGGTNHESNLVTACHKCNSVRQDRSLRTFAADVAKYVKVDAKEITAHVRDCCRRPLDVKMAREIVARRGSCSKALAARMAGKEM